MKEQDGSKNQKDDFVLLDVTPQITLGDSTCDPDDENRLCRPKDCLPICEPEFDNQLCRPKDCFPLCEPDFREQLCKPDR